MVQKAGGLSTCIQKALRCSGSGEVLGGAMKVLKGCEQGVKGAVGYHQPFNRDSLACW